MSDTVFAVVSPDTKAHDNGDGATYSLAISEQTASGTNTVFEKTDPPLRAVNLGDGTYAIAVARQDI